MNKPQAGGLEVHRANALALRLELGMPAVATGTSAVPFGGVVTASLPVMEGIARKASDDRQDAVFAVYNSDTDTKPAWYFLVFRMLDSIGMVRVEPVCIGAEKALALVTVDRSRQFAIDGRGILREMKVTKASKRSTATARAERRIAVAAEALAPVLETGAWKADTFAFQADGTAVPVDPAAA